MAACQRAAPTVAQWAAAPSGSMARSGAGPPGVSPITVAGWQCAAIQVLLPAALGPSTTMITLIRLAWGGYRKPWKPLAKGGPARPPREARRSPFAPYGGTRPYYGPSKPPTADDHDVVAVLATT